MKWTRRTVPKEFYRAMRDFLRDRAPDDYLAERVQLKKVIDSNVEDGKVIILEEGMDCDGVAFTNRKYKVQAIPAAVRYAMEKIHNDAEGTCSLRVVSPTVGNASKRTQRDLGMEAFENGHPGVIYYSG